MAEETKKSKDYIKDAQKMMNDIDVKYNDSIAKRISLKRKIADDSGTKSSTRIAGLRGLEPRLRQQFSKKYKNY